MMHDKMKMVIKRFCRFSPFLFLLLFLNACTTIANNPPGSPSALDPHGGAAARIASLWWVMFSISAAIFVLVLGLLLAAFLRRRRSTSDTPVESGSGAANSGGAAGDLGRNWIVRGGIALPFVVLAVVFGYTMYTLGAIENPQGQAGQTAIQIKVVAKRWWWEVEYPQPGFKTANELHIPVGVPVQVQLDSTDVIHSFWVPELHGKMDVIPGHTNFITLQADQPGVYRGACAEFCGLQHANMGFLVVAQSQAEYEQWLASQKQPAADPTDPAAKQGQQVFVSSGCVFCHTVRGLDVKSIDPASIHVGPDLTHVDSRLTIAGATLTNNTNNLAGWVSDPQHIKQGSDMSAVINPQDLQSLLDYLKTLR